MCSDSYPIPNLSLFYTNPISLTFNSKIFLFCSLIITLHVCACVCVCVAIIQGRVLASKSPNSPDGERFEVYS